MGQKGACCGYSWDDADEASGVDCGKDLSCDPAQATATMCIRSLRVFNPSYENRTIGFRKIVPTKEVVMSIRENQPTS